MTFRGTSQQILLFIFLFLLAGIPAVAGERYFYSGDGKLEVVGGNKKLEKLSPRLVSLIDFLQDHLTKSRGKISVFSAYRSPDYNEGLRAKGKGAAKASLHMEGMAIDFSIEGVAPKTLWHFVRRLNCCGAGYYAGQSIHLDTGPPRFWEQATSKVFTDFSLNNKQIYSTTDYDIYQPGEMLQFRLVRVTAYPFGIKNVFYLMDGNKVWKKIGVGPEKECKRIANRAEAVLTIPLPKTAHPKGARLTLKTDFCNKPSPEMPDSIHSNPFIIASPEKK